MNDIQKPEVHAKKEADGKISICLSHCQVNFQGPSLEILGDPQFTGIPQNKFSQPFISFPCKGINIAGTHCSRLTLSECDIQKSHPDNPNNNIDFRASSLRFEKCKVIGDSKDKDFSFLWSNHNQIRWTVSKLENGYLEINNGDNGYVEASNIGITWQFETNSGIKWVAEIAENEKATFGIPTNDLDKFQIKAGTIELFESTRRSISLSLKKGSSLKKLNIEKLDIEKWALVFDEINSDSDECKVRCSVRVDGTEKSTTLTLSNLRGIRDIEISIGIEKFTCDTCDFSRTNLTFLHTSSIDLDKDKFKSIATVWNPHTIMYRGFCPAPDSSIFDKARQFFCKMKTHFCRNKDVDIIPASNDFSGIPAARQFFCEMKTYFSGKGDTITAGDFHAAEMIAYRRHLRLKEKSSIGDRCDRFILLISHKSSNFGQHWHQAFLWYLFFGFVFTGILFGLMGDACARCFSSWNVWQSFDCNFFSIFLLNVLSPLNLKLTDIIPTGSGFSPNSFWVIFVWMFWKIIGGFLIFQVISSSRRFIRKW